MTRRAKQVDTPEEPWRIPEEEIARRRDLRGPEHRTASIDPPGCVDVDDALSVHALPGGGWEVGVHIADVSHFVRAGGALDMEARARGTTVYLVDRRLDMLPGVLSENLCSLLAGVDRLAVSVLWTLTPDLEVTDVWFGRTVIHSAHKLTYQQAQAMFDRTEMPPPSDPAAPPINGREQQRIREDLEVRQPCRDGRLLQSPACGPRRGLAQKARSARLCVTLSARLRCDQSLRDAQCQAPL
ncbi:hypothetical protein CYMTET_32006 [Cymbomonas tetramitiformis]|uniref:DIS3-like exonuclease 1 n=1 Tax=Cymbomonas tetramitiformis TaxID=36881 RepID=A0AAE0FGI0_9CHLO|nr:hypothetical protein CYMTET_32006 [Cymbomonas tetramitiformis]